MPTRRMLIDAAYREETRVVIHEGNQVLDFDYEIDSKQQLKGNIYLAKVTRVEPSLQAAFVDYGPDRHGFLPFSEIHPDYFQIPISDRERIKKEMLAKHAAESDADIVPIEDPVQAEVIDGNVDVEAVGNIDDVVNGNLVDDIKDIDGNRMDGPEVPQAQAGKSSQSSEEASGELKKYKIQEVIKRNQVILIQVIKEERGNKGAALTTFLSLAGRYCVLMPNSDRQGGISRRIMDGDSRRNLRKIIDDLKVPEGMSVIVRTAGSGKNESEIKRDYEYLTRLWNSIRNHTLTSKAPSFIHAEGDLLKRCIRDNYDNSIDEVLVQGEAAYKSAKQFVKLLIPSHLGRIKQYKHKTPIFSKYKVEEQLDDLYQPIVHLKSGGYIVMNPTEALTSIDVNSGKATSEKNIEETALKTNIEAAVEVARQIRLREISGLIVIDFIDMDETRHRIQVERTLREAMQHDRAKIQMGRISASFGLLEMSRQRLRPSVAELNALPCPQCEGAGIIRAPEPIAVMVLRGIENALHSDNQCGEVNVTMNSSQLVYILNYKRRQIAELEQRYDVDIYFHYDLKLLPAEFTVDKVKRSAKKKSFAAKSNVEEVELEDIASEESEEPAPLMPEADLENDQQPPQEGRERRRRRNNRRDGHHRRRRNRNGRGYKQEQGEAVSAPQEDKSLLKGIWRKIMESS